MYHCTVVFLRPPAYPLISKTAAKGAAGTLKAASIVHQIEGTLPVHRPWYRAYTIVKKGMQSNHQFPAPLLYLCRYTLK